MKKLFAALVLAGILAVPVGGFFTATDQPPLGTTTNNTTTQVATDQPPLSPSPTTTA